LLADAAEIGGAIALLVFEALNGGLEAFEGAVPELGFVDDLPALEVSTAVVFAESEAIDEGVRSLDFDQAVDLFPLLKGVVHGCFRRPGALSRGRS
jgi:hypothetical protein